MNRMRAALANDHSRTRRRVFSLALAAFLLGALALAGVASADLWTPESRGGSENAENIDTLYKIILGVAVVVFVGVEGVLLYSLVKFRVRKDAVPAQIRGNTRLEIGWTLGATVILVVLAVVTFAMLPGIRTPPNSDRDGFPTDVISNVTTASAFQPRPPNGRALKILVNGQRYTWRYTYPDKDDNVLNNTFNYVELVVPTKTTVALQIEAQDVAHSWWIPELGGKADAVPGHTNFTWFKIDTPGTYRGQCAELCGRNHADMVAQVRAIPPDEFKVWLENKKREIDENNAGALKRREEDAAKNPSAGDAPNAQAEGGSEGEAADGEEAEDAPASETETTP
jgi:cytochrome c oxidase subunit 2